MVVSGPFQSTVNVLSAVDVLLAAEAHSAADEDPSAGDRRDLMEDKEDLSAPSEEADPAPALTPPQLPAVAPFDRPFDRPLADLPLAAPEDIALCFTPARWCRA